MEAEKIEKVEELFSPGPEETIVDQQIKRKMEVEKIEKLEEIFSLSPEETIVDQQIKRLTQPGENYGSLMLSLDITVQNAYGTEEIPAVAKMVPPNEFIQKVFNTQVTFKNEIAFYKNIVPTLRQFQQEQGMEQLIDFFPKYYGSRTSLDCDSTEVDADAVLLLENLKTSGYTNVKRWEGFDLATSKMIISDLAHLHAVPLALKLKNPEIFESEVKKYLAAFPTETPEEFTKKFYPLVDKTDELKVYKTRIRKPFEVFGGEKIQPREPFATLCHCDCWVNNTMVKFQRGKPVQNKLVDFQICDYASPAKDLIFFLFSSVQNHVIEKNLDVLIRYYHTTFISVLEQLKCDTTRFSFPAFTREMDLEAKNPEFVHLMFMTWPMFAPEGSVKELSELKPEDIFPEEGDITDLHKEKLIFIVRQFAKRNWI